MNKKLTLGSLFDGISAFPLSASKYGIQNKWTSEIEKNAISIAKRHFPDAKHLGSVLDINGAEIEPVDIVTFGSPCQNLSAAGKRNGFSVTFKCKEKSEIQPHFTETVKANSKHQYAYEMDCPICGKHLVETNESALFFNAIRIIDEMRTATNGESPNYIIWENVKGALDSGSPKGSDFQSVLKEITKTDISIPESGRWAPSGMVRGGGVSVAWRLLDAQYWGVPQRRKRIFLVADFRTDSADKICFVEQSHNWN